MHFGNGEVYFRDTRSRKLQSIVDLHPDEYALGKHLLKPTNHHREATLRFSTTEPTKYLENDCSSSQLTVVLLSDKESCESHVRECFFVVGWPLCSRYFGAIYVEGYFKEENDEDGVNQGV